MAAGQHTVASNRRARHDYEIEETFETGMVLTGAEVKALRAGRASIQEAYARVRDNELWIEGLHIPPYEHGSSQRTGYDPRKPRKLLMHRNEIARLVGKSKERGLTLVPLRIYFVRGLAKLELALGRGKRQYEKRQALAEREHQREIDRGLGRRR